VSIRAARVVRHGAALELELAAGARRLVRRCDLVRSLGEPTGDRRRFAAARPLDDGGLVVELDDGAIERLGPAELGLNPRPVELVVEGGRLLTMHEGDGPLGLVTDGAVALAGGRVAWVGRRAELPKSGLDLAAARRLDAGGRLVSPGLVDCHAHPVFAGDRADEFGRRAAGHSYLEIAAAGGGINATLGPTRAATVDDLVELTCQRLAVALAAGTTTMEAKSGYDLTVAGELRLLEAALVADARSAVDLEPTLLAHLVPPERATDRATYVAELCAELVPAAARLGLCRAVDVYCDQGAFTLDEARAILGAAADLDLAVRAHAGQFADLGAAELVAALGGLSADHLEQIGEGGARALAAAGVVGVMLPGACVQLRLPPPPVARLRDAGVTLAIGSDLNPGSSYCESLPVQMWLAATHLGMTVEEVWLGVTRHAARALGRSDIGALLPGAMADLVLWDAEHPAEVPYRYGRSLVHQVIKAGRPLAG
jgi:imidazolonepropionase